MEKKKLTKADIDTVRNIEGFPIAKDEDIIALSDAPFYTACPNPFIKDFILECGKPYDETTDNYHREPFATDVSEGKGDPLYNAHGYHTKVPHKAIVKYILHYTNPGDIVFDGFCGTGMTGVAAQLCGSPDPEFRFRIESEMGEVQWGSRKVILNDLSPIASFISQNYNRKHDQLVIGNLAEKVINDCEQKYGWMYQTRHTNSIQYTSNAFLDNTEMDGVINHVVWSDVFICPTCGKEIVFWDVALDHEEGKISDSFVCHSCRASLTKKECSHAVEYNVNGNDIRQIAKQVPVYIVYTYGKKRFTKKPDNEDIELIEKIKSLSVENWYPTNILPNGDKTSDPKKVGVTSVDLFYTKRNLLVLSYLRNCLFNDLSFIYTALIDRTTRQLRLLASNFFHGGGGWVGTGLSGTLYIPSLSIELNPIETLKTKVKRTSHPLFTDESNVRIQCQSAGELKTIMDNSIDYIFTDPPFGSNINYSELSYVWEGWLKCFTNISSEAIISKSQNKKLQNYQDIMLKSFSELHRVLKPKRWITVEFHNSQNSVWNAIQETLQRAGFIIADVRILNKEQYSFNQVKGATQAIKQDLVISAYKPKESFENEFKALAGSEETAWSFVR